jgi:opacity protein-like surface antigen
MCYDPVRGYVLMVGQYPAPGGSGTVAETWSWNGAAWTLRGGAPQANAGSFQPASREANAYALAVHAATSEVFLAVDTSTTNTFGPAVVYRWDGSAWTQVASGLTPQPSTGGLAATTLGMACDPGRNQTVLYSDAAFDRVMVYGTGGFAVTNYEYRNRIGQIARMRAGTVLGAGAELTLTDNVAVRGEVLHYNYSNISFAGIGGPANVSPTNNVFRGGLNYKF